MKRCVIFGAMPVSGALRRFWQKADYVIAADAGYVSAQRLGVRVDLALGDYDSGSPPAPGAELLAAEKDDTDTHWAARRALAAGCGEVALLGCTGGRLDHTLANLATLVFLERHGARAVLADEHTEARVLLPGRHTVAARPGAYCSLFPLGARAQGVTLTGFKYPLHGAVLTNAFPLGVSNELLGAAGVVEVRTGGLYLLQCDR